jgi:hypothetical protein
MLGPTSLTSYGLMTGYRSWDYLLHQLAATL